MSPPTLRTARMVLRALAAADTAAVAEVFADPGTSRYLGGDLSDPAAATAMVGRRLAGEYPAGMGHWVFERDGEVVGLGHLRPSAELPEGLIEIGWYLGPKHSGQGLATEAAGALLSHGLNGLGLPAVWALVHDQNGPSLRLAQRLGFLAVGRGEHYGGPHQVLVSLRR